MVEEADLRRRDPMGYAEVKKKEAFAQQNGSNRSFESSAQPMKPPKEDIKKTKDGSGNFDGACEHVESIPVTSSSHQQQRYRMALKPEPTSHQKLNRQRAASHRGFKPINAIHGPSEDIHDLDRREDDSSSSPNKKTTRPRKPKKLRIPFKGKGSTEDGFNALLEREGSQITGSKSTAGDAEYGMPVDNYRGPFLNSSDEEL